MFNDYRMWAALPIIIFIQQSSSAATQGLTETGDVKSLCSRFCGERVVGKDMDGNFDSCFAGEGFMGRLTVVTDSDKDK